MAFSKEYEKMSDKDRECLGRVINSLLAHTFILKQDFSAENVRFNDDYYFASANIDLINEYLSVIGCRADNNTFYGIISLSLFPDSSRAHFDKFTTQMIYTLRLIYEERRDSLDSAFIAITTGELITKMIETDLIDKKPSNKDLVLALRKIRDANVIAKGKGSFDNENTKIMILPSILLILSETKLKETFEKLRKDTTDGEEAEYNEET